MTLAVIGGTGLTALEGLGVRGQRLVSTPWGEPSAPLVMGSLRGAEVLFLARHGAGHTIAPHRINYRANVWALREAGATAVVGVAAVGGIRGDLGPGALVVPDQIVDYTWGREHTFHDGEVLDLEHVDFTWPYAAALRERLLDAGRAAGVSLAATGTYGATQGPRLESAAEIDRMERDGCDVVGMTGMPEAALAREAGLEYAHLAVVANAAAGRGTGRISMDEIRATLGAGMARARAVLGALVAGSPREPS